MRQPEARTREGDEERQEQKHPLEVPDQLGRGPFEDEGRNVLRDRVAEDVGLARGDAGKQPHGQGHGLDSVGRDERGHPAQEQQDGKRTHRRRGLALARPAAKPARRQPRRDEVHGHEQRTERRQALTVAPHDLQQRQEHPWPAPACLSRANPLQHQEKEGEKDHGEDRRSHGHEVPVEQEPAQHRDRAQVPGRGPRALGGSHQDHGPAGDQHRLRQGETDEARGRVDGEGAELEEPVHVDPGPARGADRERIDAQKRSAPHDVAPGGQMPVDVTVGNRAERDEECARDHGGEDEQPRRLPPTLPGCRRGMIGQRAWGHAPSLHEGAIVYFHGNQLLLCMSWITRAAQSLCPCMSKW